MVVGLKGFNKNNNSVKNLSKLFNLFKFIIIIIIKYRWFLRELDSIWFNNRKFIGFLFKYPLIIIIIIIIKCIIIIAWFRLRNNNFTCNNTFSCLLIRVVLILHRFIWPSWL